MKKKNNTMFKMTDAEFKSALKSLRNTNIFSNRKENGNSVFTTKEIYDAFGVAFNKRNEEVYGR
jgi:hypothetical protein